MQQYHICTRTLQWSHKKPESSTVVVITDSKMSQTFTKEMDASLSLLWFPVPFPALSQPKLWWGPSLPSPTKCRPVWNSSLCSPAPIQQLRKPSWGVFILSSIEEYFWGGVKETMFETTMKSCESGLNGWWQAAQTHLVMWRDRIRTNNTVWLCRLQWDLSTTGHRFTRSILSKLV